MIFNFVYKFKMLKAVEFTKEEILKIFRLKSKNNPIIKINIKYFKPGIDRVLSRKNKSRVKKILVPHVIRVRIDRKI